MVEKLFIMVEGIDDERFFKRIIKPLFKNKYNNIKIWQHAQRSKKDKQNLLSSIEVMGADYIYVEDIDDVKKIHIKKRKIMDRIDFVDYNKIVIVVKEIESWYLAGINRKVSDELNIPCLEKTDDIYKEDFNDIIPFNFLSRIDFMQELLNHFSFKTAVNKNESFNYFIQTFIAPLYESIDILNEIAVS
jgi:hypothetical protein